MNKQNIFIGLGLLLLLALGGRALYPRQEPVVVVDDSEAGIGHAVTESGVTITPLEVLEDSRCPSDVQCIWAGTVKLRATLKDASGTSEQIFELGQPVTTEAEVITLTEVTPYPKSGEIISTPQYVFRFQISKR